MRSLARRGARTAVLVLVVLATLAVAFQSRHPYADARGAVLGAGPPLDAYPYAAQADPQAVDPWGFEERQCTSYVAWYLNTHGVPFANRTSGPRGVGTFGPAGEWAQGAAEAGFGTSATPVPGAVAQWLPGESSPETASPLGGLSYDYDGYRLDEEFLLAGRYGHVAVVLQVLPDESVVVSEYDGTERRFEVLWTRAPRYLYIGVPGSVPVRTSGVAPGAARAPARVAAPAGGQGCR